MDDIYRRRFLLDVDDAEAEAKQYLDGVANLDKLLVSDGFNGFGGLSTAPALSLSGVDEMALKEKRVWIACRLWAICQKIRSMDNPPAKAGVELARYKSWLNNPGASRKAAGASGGRRLPPYSADLDTLINQVVLENLESKQLPQTVFKKLPGMSGGVIERITEDLIDGVAVLLVCWDGDNASSPERQEQFKEDAIRKRVAKLMKK